MIFLVYLLLWACNFFCKFAENTGGSYIVLLLQTGLRIRIQIDRIRIYRRKKPWILDLDRKSDPDPALGKSRIRTLVMTSKQDKIRWSGSGCSDRIRRWPFKTTGTGSKKNKQIRIRTKICAFFKTGSGLATLGQEIGLCRSNMKGKNIFFFTPTLFAILLIKSKQKHFSRQHFFYILDWKLRL